MTPQVRLGMGACAGAACRCVHFLPVLQEPPSGQLQTDAWPIPISLRCRSTCCNHEEHGRPVGCLHSRGSSLRENLVRRISVRKMSHMSIQPQLILTDNTGNKPRVSICVSLSNRSFDTKSDQR